MAFVISHFLIVILVVLAWEPWSVLVVVVDFSSPGELPLAMTVILALTAIILFLLQHLLLLLEHLQWLLQGLLGLGGFLLVRQRVGEVIAVTIMLETALELLIVIINFYFHLTLQHRA